MKKLLIIFLLLVVAFPVAGQNDSLIKKTISKNQIDLDVEFLGVSLGYKKKIHRNWFVGGRFGIGLTYTTIHFTPISYYLEDSMSFFSNSRKFEGLETFHTQLLIQYSFKNIILVEFGPRFSTLWEGPEGDAFVRIGFNTSFYIGIRRVKVGIRVGFLSLTNNDGHSFSNDERYSNSFLIVKIPLRFKPKVN